MMGQLTMIEMININWKKIQKIETIEVMNRNNSNHYQE